MTAPVRTAASVHAEYRPEIDGLRCIAILSVLINHADRHWLPSGYLGVDVFYVISGFVITKSLSGQMRPSLWPYLASFYAARFKRLIPALALCVVVTSLIGVGVMSPHADQFKSTWRAGALAMLGLSNLLFFRDATDYFGAPAELNLFTQTWSLGVEEQFYLVYPLLLWITAQHFLARATLPVRLALLIALSAASLAAFVYLHRSYEAAAFFLMPTRFWQLGLGCLVCLTLDAYRPRLGAVGGAMATAALAGIVALFFVPQQFQVPSTVAITLCTAALIAGLGERSVARKLLMLRPVVYIGVISYSLYLWHWSVLVLSRWTIGVHWWSVPFQFALILALSILSYRLVEKPLRRARWAPTNWRTILYGLGTAGAAAAVCLVLGGPLKGRLYAGETAKLELHGLDTLDTPKFRDGRQVWSTAQCALASSKDVGKQIKAADCTIGASAAGGRRFLVIGNSFSTAQYEMVEALADKGIGNVTLVTSFGAAPVAELAPRMAWRQAHRYYWESIVPPLVADLRAGDGVIMINGLVDWSPQRRTSDSDANIARLKESLMRFSSELAERGISVVFQDSLPFATEAGCSPDMALRQWYNLPDANVCHFYARAETLERREPLHRALQEIEAARPNFRMLDLFDIFCPGKTCTYNGAGGVFLYRDAYSHPSVEANRLAQGTLLKVVATLPDPRAAVGSAPEAAKPEPAAANVTPPSPAPQPTPEPNRKSGQPAALPSPLPARSPPARFEQAPRPAPPSESRRSRAPVERTIDPPIVLSLSMQAYCERLRVAPGQASPCQRAHARASR